MQLAVLPRLAAAGGIGWRIGRSLGAGKWSVLLGAALLTSPFLLMVIYRYSSWSWLLCFPCLLALLHTAIRVEDGSQLVDLRMTLAAWVSS